MFDEKRKFSSPAELGQPDAADILARERVSVCIAMRYARGAFGHVFRRAPFHDILQGLLKELVEAGWDYEYSHGEDSVCYFICAQSSEAGAQKHSAPSAQNLTLPSPAFVGEVLDDAEKVKMEREHLWHAVRCSGGRAFLHHLRHLPDNDRDRLFGELSSAGWRSGSPCGCYEFGDDYWIEPE